MVDSEGRLTLVLVTHDQKLAEETCDSVTVPGAEGYLTVLPGHSPLVTTLTPGRLSYRAASQGREWVVDAGFCEISGDVVTVLADSAQEPGDVDRDAALELKRQAEEQLLAAEVELVERAREQLALAEARLEAGD